MNTRYGMGVKEESSMNKWLSDIYLHNYKYNYSPHATFSCSQSVILRLLIKHISIQDV